MRCTGQAQRGRLARWQFELSWCSPFMTTASTSSGGEKETSPSLSTTLRSPALGTAGQCRAGGSGGGGRSDTLHAGRYWVWQRCCLCWVLLTLLNKPPLPPAALAAPT